MDLTASDNTESSSTDMVNQRETARSITTRSSASKGRPGSGKLDAIAKKISCGQLTTNEKVSKRKSAYRRKVDEPDDIDSPVNDESKPEISNECNNSNYCDDGDDVDSGEREEMLDTQSVSERVTRRGRKKTQPRKFIDPSIKLNTFQITPEKKRKRVLKPKKLADEDCNKSWVCGSCQEIFMEKVKAEYHVLATHNGVARLNSDEPFTANEEREAMKHCLRKLKKLTCPRIDCQKSLTTLPGYKIHVQYCGSKETVECDICGTVLKPVSLIIHKKTMHSNNGSPNTSTTISEGRSDDEEQTVTSDGRGSRKAAIRCRLSMEEKLSEGADGKIEEEKFNDVVVDDLITYNEREVIVTQELINEWRQELDASAQIRCPMNLCNKSFTTIAGAKYHYTRCGKDKNYLCVECGFRSDNRANIKRHAMTHINPSSSYANKRNNNDDVSGLKSVVKVNKSYNTNSFHSFLPAFIDTFRFHIKHSKDDLFQSWLPSSELWSLLEASNWDKYLPVTRTSPKFCCKKLGDENECLRNKQASVRFNDRSGKMESSEPWETLSLFETSADVGDFNCNLFVGGSTWSIAWCPTPQGAYFTNDKRQYLAVSIDVTYDQLHLMNDTRCGPGLIQIWSFGIMLKDGLSSLPYVAFCIAHDFGRVYSMQWCPFGVYSTDSDDNADLERIGLLAIACSDGNVYIYSVPSPESLGVAPSGDNPSIYKPLPNVHLKPPTSNRSACLSLSWLPSNDCNRLIAGFSNGVVCIWDLTTKSQLLCQDLDDNRYQISPHIVFISHQGPVADVSWCPNTYGQHFCTVSVDREVKIWATNDTENPLLSWKKASATACSWSLLSAGIFVAYDDSYQYKLNRTYYVECGYLGHQARCLAIHNSCITNISISDWLNTQVSCDHSGEVVAIICHRYQEVFKNKKNRQLYKTLPIFRTSTEPLSEVVDSGNENEDYRITSYGEAVEHNGIVFHDAPVYSYCDLPASELARVSSVDGMSVQPFRDYNLQAVNVVAWNPNAGSHCWLASGCHSGFVRLHCISGIHNPQLDEINKSYIDDLVKKLDFSMHANGDGSVNEKSDIQTGSENLNHRYDSMSVIDNNTSIKLADVMETEHASALVNPLNVSDDRRQVLMNFPNMQIDGDSGN